MPKYYSIISIKLQSNFIEITLGHGFSPVNLLHIFRTPSLNPNKVGLFEGSFFWGGDVQFDFSHMRS